MGNPVPYNRPLLNKNATTQVQEISGTFLYYAWATFNMISNQQANQPKNMAKACKQFIAYLSTLPKAIICFHASDMILSLVSDAANLVLPDARIAVPLHTHFQMHPLLDHNA